MKRFGPGRPLFVFLALLVPVLLMSASALATGPTGTGPNDAMMVPIAGQAIGPNTTLWFYFDYDTQKLSGGRGGRPFPGGPRGGGSLGRVPVAVAVDANGIGGLTFAVYTPDQAKSWMSDPTTVPVGRGTPYRDTSNGLITHDLYWAGGFNVSGRYFVAVTNSNPGPVTFSMIVYGDTVTLYPQPEVTPTPGLYVPITLTPIPTTTLPGKIIFEDSTGGLIYTVNGDGSNLTHVAQGIDPAWSPDGKRFTYASWDNTNPGLFIANADGSEARLLFGAPRVRWPRWSPDGRFIVFSQDKSKDDKNLSWKLGVVEVATGHLTEPQCSKLCYVPSWSPDGTTIVYTDPDIGVLAANVLNKPPALIGPTGTYWDSNANIPRPIAHWPPIQNSDLSPDGKRIVYSMQAQDRWELNTMSWDGSNQMGITGPDPILSILFDKVVHNVAPTWSPDSQQILFLSDRGGKWEFFVTDPNGQNIRQVLKNVTDLVSLNFVYQNERMMDWTH